MENEFLMPFFTTQSQSHNFKNFDNSIWIYQYMFCNRKILGAIFNDNSQVSLSQQCFVVLWYLFSSMFRQTCHLHTYGFHRQACHFYQQNNCPIISNIFNTSQVSQIISYYVFESRPGVCEKVASGFRQVLRFPPPLTIGWL